MPVTMDAVVLEEDGVARHDIAALSQMMAEKFPGESRATARAALHILAMTRATLELVLERVEEADVQWAGPSEEIRNALVADLVELSGRLDLYEYAMAGLQPGDVVPSSVFPLLFLIEGDKTGRLPFFTPEWLTPFIVDNQRLELEQHRREVQSFFEELMVRTIELAQDPLPEMPSFSESSGPLMTGAMALAAGVAAIGLGYVFGRLR